MNPTSSVLFNKIIQCPNLSKLSGNCGTILDTQSCCYRRQVPEPWSGDIDNAPFLIIGSNPAFVCNEVFPSKDSCCGNWIDMGDGKTTWNKILAENYFEGRFGIAICPANRSPYYNPTNGTVLSITPTGIAPQKVQNQYWKTYNDYCRAICATLHDINCAITDLVHCNSPKQTGVSQAMKTCIRFTEEVIELFAQNGATNRSILLIGSGSSSKRLISVFDKWGGLNAPSPVGNFNRSGVHNDIFKSSIVICGQSIDVYYNIPAPSGANRASCPVTLNGVKIKW